MTSSLLLKKVLLSLFLGGAVAWAPDGGMWHQPGSPFIVPEQLPTRHVGKEGTRYQSDPYGMPSYGRLHENAYDYRAPSVRMDFRPPSYHHNHEVARQRAAGFSSPPPPPTAQEQEDAPPQEPKVREFERQQYFRTKADYRRPEKRDNGAVPQDLFFASGRPNGFEVFPEIGMPGYFQRVPPPLDFSFMGRPSTSFHQQPLRPDFY